MKLFIVFIGCFGIKIRSTPEAVKLLLLIFGKWSIGTLQALWGGYNISMKDSIQSICISYTVVGSKSINAVDTAASYVVIDENWIKYFFIFDLKIEF